MGAETRGPKDAERAYAMSTTFNTGDEEQHAQDQHVQRAVNPQAEHVELADARVMANEAGTSKPGANIVMDAVLHDLAMHMVSGIHDRAELALAINVGPARLGRLMNDPRFQAIYERVQRKIYDNLGDMLTDEKAAPLLRQQALAQRGMTLLAEVGEKLRAMINTDKVDEHGDPVVPDASYMRAAISAASKAIDVGAMGRRARDGNAPAVQINVFSANETQAASINAAYDEAGISMGDVLSEWRDDARDDDNMDDAIDVEEVHSDGETPGRSHTRETPAVGDSNGRGNEADEASTPHETQTPVAHETGVVDAKEPRDV